MELKSELGANDVMNSYTGNSKEVSPHEIVVALFNEEYETFDNFMKELIGIKDSEGTLADKIRFLRELDEKVARSKLRSKKIIYLMSHSEALPIGKSKEEISVMLDNPSFLSDDIPEMGGK